MKTKGGRLALFLPTLAGGGAERITLNLAKELSRHREVDLVVRSADGALLREIPATVRLVNFETGRMLTSVPALVRYLRQERPMALISSLDYANIVAVWAHRIARVPARLILTEHNTLSVAMGAKTTLDGRVRPHLTRLFYRLADEIVAVSEGVADDLAGTARIARGRIRVIYNPVITPELEERSRAPLDHHWFEPEQPPVVVAAGRLTAQKDFPTLLRAFHRVRKERTLRLLILGDGPDRPALDEIVRELNLSEDVSLPGFVDNPYAYMRRAAAFVNSSRWEGLPTALIEALYCGAPVAATDCPSGPREILQAGRYGLLVPVGDDEALAGAIETILDGRAPLPSPPSWRPYEAGLVGEQYLALAEGH